MAVSSEYIRFDESIYAIREYVSPTYSRVSLEDEGGVFIEIHGRRTFVPADAIEEVTDEEVDQFYEDVGAMG